MRTFVVVVLLKLGGDCLHLFEGVGAMHGQTFCLIAAVIALHEAVLLGLLRVAQPNRDP